MQSEEFAGASKINTSFLKPLERRLEPIVLPRIPIWIESYHLTMLTVIWCLGILGFSYLCGKRHPLVVGGVCNDRASIRNRSLRWQTGEVSRHRPRALGLLHGPSARLLLPCLGDHRLCIHLARAFPLSAFIYAGALCRLRREHGPGFC